MKLEKLEYPPLLAPGFHPVTLDDLETLFVEPFSSRPWVRRTLVRRFRALIATICDLGLTCEIWIDGSFVTEKLEPSDIDLLVLSDDEKRSKLTVSQQSAFEKLITHKDRTRVRFSCDLFYCGNDNPVQKEKWTNDFGRALISKEPKGIACLRLNHD